MEKLNLEKTTLKHLIESKAFKERISSIRDKTFEEYGAHKKYRKVREYGFGVEGIEDGVYISDIVKGTSNKTPFHLKNAIFEESIVLVDVHSHKLVNGNALPPTGSDLGAWWMLSTFNGASILNNHKLIKYGMYATGIIVFFYDKNDMGMIITRFDYEFDLDSFWKQIRGDLSAKGFRDKDFREEKGVVAYANYCKDMGGYNTFYMRSKVDEFCLPDELSEKLPLLNHA